MTKNKNVKHPNYTHCIGIFSRVLITIVINTNVINNFVKYYGPLVEVRYQLKDYRTHVSLKKLKDVYHLDTFKREFRLNYNNLVKRESPTTETAALVNKFTEYCKIRSRTVQQWVQWRLQC